MKINKFAIGCWIDRSASSADSLNHDTCRLAERHGFKLDNEAEQVLARHEDDCMTDDDGQTLSEMADESISWLNDNLELPPYCSFMFEDNSLFLMPSVDNARESVEFVSVKSHAEARRLGIETDEDDSSFPPADYQGEWLHVSDHGNATLYVRNEDGKDVELWSVV